MPKTQKKYGVRRRTNTRKKYRKSKKKRNNLRKNKSHKITRKRRRRQRGGVKNRYQGSLTTRALDDKLNAAKRKDEKNDAGRAKRNKKNKDLILKRFLDKMPAGVVSTIMKQAHDVVGEPMREAGIDNTNFAIGDGGKDKMNRQMRQQMREGIH